MAIVQGESAGTKRRRTDRAVRRSFPTAVSTASGSKGLSQPAVPVPPLRGVLQHAGPRGATHNGRFRSRRAHARTQLQATATAPAGVGNIGVGLRPAGPCDRRAWPTARRCAASTRAKCAWSRCAARCDRLGDSATTPSATPRAAALRALREGLAPAVRVRGRTRQGHSDRRGARRLGRFVRRRARRRECVAGCAVVARRRCIRFAMEGEYASSRSHQGDNVGPMLVGGVVLATATRLMPLACAGVVALRRRASGPGAGNAAFARSAGRTVPAVDRRRAWRAPRAVPVGAGTRRCRIDCATACRTCSSNRAARRSCPVSRE